MKLWSFLSFSLTFLYHSFSQGLKKQPTPIPLFSLSRHIYHDYIIINYLDNYLTYVLIRPKQKALGFRLFFFGIVLSIFLTQCYSDSSSFLLKLFSIQTCAADFSSKTFNLWQTAKKSQTKPKQKTNKQTKWKSLRY